MCASIEWGVVGIKLKKFIRMNSFLQPILLQTERTGRVVVHVCESYKRNWCTLPPLEHQPEENHHDELVGDLGVASQISSGMELGMDRADCKRAYCFTKCYVELIEYISKINFCLYDFILNLSV